MSSTSVTKVTSLGSQYSASGVPTVPNPTPVTESLEDGENGAPQMDLAAVANILAPIQEQLNGFAEEAYYPSPPANTPMELSPESSIISRHYGRGRGSVYDRLEMLRIESRKHPRRGADGAYSNSSVEPSVAEDECEIASISEVYSDGNKDKAGAAHYSSPTANPRVEEYLSFTSSDLPPIAPAANLPFTHVEEGSASANTSSNLESGRDSVMSDGVTEKSNWAEEVEDNVDHACMRLEQLAKDEHVADSSKTVDEYYVARLQRLLGSRKRNVPVKIEKM